MAFTGRQSQARRRCACAAVRWPPPAWAWQGHCGVGRGAEGDLGVCRGSRYVSEGSIQHPQAAAGTRPSNLHSPQVAHALQQVHDLLSHVTRAALLALCKEDVVHRRSG